MYESIRFLDELAYNACSGGRLCHDMISHRLLLSIVLARSGLDSSQFADQDIGTGGKCRQGLIQGSLYDLDGVIQNVI